MGKTMSQNNQNVLKCQTLWQKYDNQLRLMRSSMALRMKGNNYMKEGIDTIHHRTKSSEALEHRDKATESAEEDREKKLPEGWKLLFLRDVAFWGSGGTPSRARLDYYCGDIPWIKTGELGKGDIKDTEEHISDDALANSSAKVYPADSIAIAMYGATIGKTARLAIAAACNQACAIAVCRNICIPAYLQKYLDANNEQFKKLGQGGAQPNISQEIIKSYPIPLPPLPEQERIAARLYLLLGKLKAARTRLDAIPELIKRFRKSVLAEAVSGRLTEDWRAEHGNVILEWCPANSGNRLLDDMSESYERESLPDSWRWHIIDDVGTVKGGKRLPIGAKYCDVKTKFPYLMAGALKNGTVDESKIVYIDKETHEAISNYIVFSGDVYITIVGACIGDAGIIPEWASGANLTENALRITYLNGLSGQFLSIWLRSPLAQTMIASTVLSGAQGKLALGRVRALPVPLPCIYEQSEIVRRVDELFAYADALESRVAAARALADRLEPAILAKAFRGELSEQIPEEAAEWEKILAEIEAAATDLGEKLPAKRGRKPQTEIRLAASETPVAGKRKRGRPLKNQ